MTKRYISNDDIDAFAGAWFRMSGLGACDDIGGAEFQRVRQEWEDAGMPRPIDQYIYRRANINADGIEPPPR